MLVGTLSSEEIIFTDDFDDHTNTGWTYLNRDGAVEIADAVWVETGGRLEQQTTNYDFPRDANGNDPVLGAIALAPQLVGDRYSLSAEFTSLEPGNTFQDQDFVFGYVNGDNFFMMETIPGGLRVFNVTGGDRVLIASSSLAFIHDPTTVVLEHNAKTGEVIVTYGTAQPVTFSDPVFVRSGDHQVGVGSNNDAFAIDDFTITQLEEPGEPSGPEITSITYSEGNGTATITWASEAAVRYTVSRSFDLEVWDDIDGSVVGLEETTSVDDSGGGLKAFYRVSRNPAAP